MLTLTYTCKDPFPKQGPIHRLGEGKEGQDTDISFWRPLLNTPQPLGQKNSLQHPAPRRCVCPGWFLGADSFGVGCSETWDAQELQVKVTVVTARNGLCNHNDNHLYSPS